MSKKFFKLIASILCLSLFICLGVDVNASTIENKAVDTVSRNYSHTFNHTRNAISVDPDFAEVPSSCKSVKFKIVLNTKMQFDRITGKYVSAETPRATLQYTGPVPLQMSSVSTSKQDNGNSVTFSYRANITATVDTGFVILKISYGSVSGSFTVNK